MKISSRLVHLIIDIPTFGSIFLFVAFLLEDPWLKKLGPLCCLLYILHIINFYFTNLDPNFIKKISTVFLCLCSFVLHTCKLSRLGCFWLTKKTLLLKTHYLGLSPLSWFDHLISVWTCSVAASRVGKDC